MSESIESIKEQISDLKEYLNSDICRGCGEVAIKLEGYIERLKALLENTGS